MLVQQSAADELYLPQLKTICRCFSKPTEVSQLPLWGDYIPTTYCLEAELTSEIRPILDSLTHQKNLEFGYLPLLDGGDPFLRLNEARLQTTYSDYFNWDITDSRFY